MTQTFRYLSLNSLLTINLHRKTIVLKCGCSSYMIEVSEWSRRHWLLCGVSENTCVLQRVPFVVPAGCPPTELGGRTRKGERLHPGLPSRLWVSQPAMDDSSSLGKVSSSTESVATVTSEEFVLVQSSAAGSPQGSGGKPRLKVRTEHLGTCTHEIPIPPQRSKIQGKVMLGRLVIDRMIDSVQEALHRGCPIRRPWWIGR